MRNKANNVSAMVSCIFAFIGVIFLMVGIFIGLSNEKFKENADEVVAVITSIESYRDSDGDREYDVYVDYSYGGQYYQNKKLNMYSSSMYEGKEIDILVDRDNPGRISAGSGMMVITLIMAGIGFAMMIGAMIPFILMIRQKTKRNHLKQNGYTIEATVTDIILNHNLSVNGQHPFVVYCTYQDIYSGTEYRFKSENLWTDPEPVIQPGRILTVYVNSHNDFSKYYVDVESALESRIVDYT